MTTPTTTEDFLALIERSGLLPPSMLVGYAARSQTGADPELESAVGMARLMVTERVLTPFQARQFLNGRFRGFFLTEKHKILEPLGAGGMGRVLLCEHMVLQRLVAVKVLHVGADQPAGVVERFLREARVAASLDHPNIVRTFDADRGQIGPYLVMEYVDGSNLHQIVARHGPMTVERAAHYIWQAAAGLEHAHQSGLIHRDIKPGNFLLDRSGTVKVLDLGLARFFDPNKNDNLTAQFDDKNVIGTVDYIAPEQAISSSTVDIRADIYGLGCTLYQMLSGRSPYEGMTSAEKLLAHQLRDPEAITSIRADVPKDLADALTIMLRKRPEDRFQTPAEAMDALNRWSNRLPPPPAEEMPKIAASSYRLGLCPAPSSIGDPQSGVTPSVGSSGTPTAVTGPSSMKMKMPDRQGTNRPQTPRPLTGGPKSSNAALGRPAPSVAGPRTSRVPEGALPAMSRPVSRPAQPMPNSARRPVNSAPQQAAHAPSGNSDATSPKKGFTRQRAFVMTAFAAGALATVIVTVSIMTLLSPSSPVASGKPTTKTPPTIDPKTLPTVETSKTPDTKPVVSAKLAFTAGGSSFVKPIMDSWAASYLASTGVNITYESCGSGQGVARMTSQSIPFGCTDAFMDETQLRVAQGQVGTVVHVPLVMGAVVPIYNVPGVKVPIRFTGAILADIYLGAITKWNDPAIAINNPDIALPDLPIVVVGRADESGTSFIWTDYLSKVSGEWKTKVGASTTPKWPVGKTDKKNDGIATAVKQETGSIGYVEMTFALKQNLPMGYVQNKAGEFIKPTPASVTAAMATIVNTVPDDLRFTLTNCEGKESYPISGCVWAVLYQTQPVPKEMSPEKAAERTQEMVKFLNWVVTEGQKKAPAMYYAPLPKELVPRIEAKLKTVTQGK